MSSEIDVSEASSKILGKAIWAKFMVSGPYLIKNNGY